MKRILYAFIVAAAFLAVGCNPDLEQSTLKVTPMQISVESASITKMLNVTATDSWTLTLTDDAEWCVPEMTSGKGNASFRLNINANRMAEERTAQLLFASAGCEDVIVTVTQAAGSGSGSDEEYGEFYPDEASGISVSPAYPSADESCTIRFSAPSGSELYGYAGDIYMHIGVIVDDEWSFVPFDWSVNNDKCKMVKNAEGVYELTLAPTIREFFGSGEAPVTKIAMVVRSDDGSKQTRPDQYCSVKDDTYVPETFTPDPVTRLPMPSGAEYGINYNSDGTVTFVLYDKDTEGKYHSYCYIVGDWNNWERVSEGAMKRDDAAGCWWITLDGFDSDQEYRFQYRLGNDSGSDTYVSDPYTEIVYDQWNDQYISGVPAFPEKAKALVSAFQINRPSYTWQVPDFKVEDRNDLVIYEMLFRDFTTSKDIAGAMAQLDYIEDLGVNAIELMPVQEFDGNLSWGYNPNHWFALDKAYGTREQYKQFIDECHRRGIAVIFDVVYNHATGSHTWAKMYWDSTNSATAANNPWFNAVAKHPYNVYHDMNHENEMVQEHVKKSLEYLLTEYNVDGFRFDLTKGFTQNDTGEDVAAWGRYDQSRVDILTGYAEHIRSVNEDAVVIFEHLSDWDEEKVLAEYGIQLWRNVNGEYRSAVAGGSGNFTNMYSSSPFGGYVGYMESHDEERLCYGVTSDVSSVTWGVIGLGDKWAESDDVIMSADGVFFVAKNVTAAEGDRFKIRKAGEWNDAYNYGASADNFKLTAGQGYVMTNGSGSKDMYVPAAGTYDIYFCPDVETVWLMNAGQRPAEPEITGGAEDALTLAMRRAGASAAFFLTVPGPKMIWQFGEIGYDYSIDYNERTGEKPVVTADYLAVPARKALYDTYSALLKFRRENPRFFDSDASFSWTPSAAMKTITCSADGRTFHVVGNFGKSAQTYDIPSGSWKDYMDGGAAVSGTITLKPGEFKLLTDF